MTADLETFGKHAVASATERGDILRVIDPLVDDMDRAGLRNVADWGLAWYETELDWLSSNEPAPCYVAAYEAWAVAAHKFGQGFATLKRALGPPLSERVLGDALAALQQGVAAFDAATDEMERISPDCR